jgi:hypothetical protein
MMQARNPTDDFGHATATEEHHKFWTISQESRAAPRYRKRADGSPAAVQPNKKEENYVDATKTPGFSGRGRLAQR